MTDEGVFLALSLGDKSSWELITRDHRPLYATRAQWEKVSKTLPATLVPTTVHGLPFGALPLMDDGTAPDPIAVMMDAMVDAMAEAAREVAAAKIVPAFEEGPAT